MLKASDVPPGRARVLHYRFPTGSNTSAKALGLVCVANFRAAKPGLDHTTSNSGATRDQFGSADANCGRNVLSSEMHSERMLRPSTSQVHEVVV